MDTESTENTEGTRVRREQAAFHVGVAPRTINRWRARGLITASYDPAFRAPSTYDLKEVEAAAALTLAEGRRVHRRTDNQDIST